MKEVAYTLENIISSAKPWEDIIDIPQLMSGNTHLGFDRDRNAPPNLLK
jgi:hypothetical protein